MWQQNKEKNNVEAGFDIDELTITDQIESAKKALAAVIRLSHINKSNYWEKKKTEIQLKIQSLEGLKQTF